MKRQREIAGKGSPSPSDFCEFFPAEFRTACDPYCWACGPRGAPRAPDAHPHGYLAPNHHGDARSIAHDPEDVDLHPYFWDLKEDGCTCHR